jgi:hypothetical protein
MQVHVIGKVLNMVVSPVRLADGNLWLPVGSDRDTG